MRNVFGLVAASAGLLAFVASAGLLAFVAPASADVFSGTHPKLGTVNLSMNSECIGVPDDCKTYVAYRYSIRSKKLIAYGSGETRGERFDARKGEALVSDNDNEGNVCSGKLSRSWWGNDLKVAITYDARSDCPIAGKTYTIHLKRQPNSVGFVVGTIGNPIQKIWLASDRYGKRSKHYVIPGDLVTMTGNGRGPNIQIRINQINGFLSYGQFLRNQEYLSWGV